MKMSGISERINLLLLPLFLLAALMFPLKAFAADTHFEETDPAITYTGAWANYTCAGCSAGGLKHSSQTGAKAQFSFNGSAITWVVAKANNLGKAKVYLDGAYMGLVDLYSSSTKYRVILQKTGLTPGAHTATIEVSGQKNIRSTGKIIDIDAFEVGSTGILIKSISIVGEEPAGGDNEIDAALHLCPPDFTTLEPGLFNANAKFTIDAGKAGGNPFPASIEKCDITYLKGIGSPDSPIIEGLTIYPNCTLIEKADNQCNMLMMDVDRKVKWWADANTINLPSIYPTPYTVRYDCTFVDSGNQPGTFQAEYDIWLADWDYCQ